MNDEEWTQETANEELDLTYAENREESREFDDTIRDDEDDDIPDCADERAGREPFAV